MINLASYALSDAELASIENLLRPVEKSLELEDLWRLIDQAWRECRCSNRRVSQENYASFYQHPVWLLNGIFVEQDKQSMDHRRAINNFIAGLAPQRVVDFGGGFGTLARLIANSLPSTAIDICEPFPPRHGIQACRPYANISFVSELKSQHYDVLVSTDVLEHVPDPIRLLAEMVDSVRPGGHLVLANCFYPVIQCHLPSTFHLRHRFDSFAELLGLDPLGPCEGSHASVYVRSRLIEPCWQDLRKLEKLSKREFFWQRVRDALVEPWRQRLLHAAKHPMHYPRKLFPRHRQPEH